MATSQLTTLLKLGCNTFINLYYLYLRRFVTKFLLSSCASFKTKPANNCDPRPDWPSMECLGCVSPTGHICSATVLTFHCSEMLFLSICLQDVKTVRVGRPEKIRPELEKITLDNQCKLYKQLAQASLIPVW